MWKPYDNKCTKTVFILTNIKIGLNNVSCRVVSFPISTHYQQCVSKKKIASYHVEIRNKMLKSTDLLQAEDKGSTGNMFSSLDRHLRQH
jgi:hypothetical protein